MLHRVLPEREGSFQPNKDMAISPEFLEDFILNAKGLGYTFVSMDRFVKHLVSGSGQNLLTLTFDDGYKDNAIVAYPLLSRLGIPFTLYVTTSFLDGNAILWWYALERLIQDANRISLANGQIIFCRSSREKLDAFVMLRDLVMAMPQDVVVDRINSMFPQLKLDWQRLCSAEAMNWNDLQELARDPLVTVGAHTVHHPVMSQLSAEQASAEMRDSRARLENFTDASVTHFCYPFGSRNEVGARDFALAHESGFITATTTRWGNIFPSHKTRLHSLPRVPLTNSFSWAAFRKQSIRRFMRGRLVTE
ncbi:polysaccharide deacetylase family protein [Rhodobacterales bacterium LSUCC0387]|nr:polysaccharide deacetylase family protein [Rhodobacterales bacterium LSUCC0387]